MKLTFRVAQHEPKTVRWWYDLYCKGHLDVQPKYQRRSNLWNAWKQAHLIDSILNGYDVPKFYVADFAAGPSALNVKKVPYAIIDGKQRFEAIFAFFSGSLRLNSSFRLELEPELQLGGTSFSELQSRHPQVASRFEGFSPVVMSVVTNDDSRIEEMFIRLNSGEAINRAEKRNAMPGPVPEAIRDLILHPFFQRKIRFTTKRMQEANLAAKLLLLEHKKAFVDTKANNLDDFVDEAFKLVRPLLQKETPVQEALDKAVKPYRETEARVFENLERLSIEFEDRDPLLSAQGSIPLYYWLCREIQDSGGLLRQFLEVFTTSVRENLQLSRTKPDSADQELLTFYTMGRTTNDAQSLKGRYRILVSRFNTWKAERAQQTETRGSRKSARKG